MFREETFFLNRSGSKRVVVGVEPNTNGEFERLLCIFDKKGLTIRFHEGQIHHLFSRLQAVIPTGGKRITIAEVSEKRDNDKDSIRVTKADYGQNIWIIENDNSGYSRKMVFGLCSLQRLLQLNKVIIYSFSNKDYRDTQRYFMSLVEEVQNMRPSIRGNIDRVREYLFDTAEACFELTDEECPHYTIARDTLANFEEYFLFMVEQINK